jgi:hypothetical protein
METVEFLKYIRLRQEQLKVQSFADLQDEMAGRENAKQKRFFPHDVIVAEKARKEREDFSDQMTALMLRMQDAAYAKMYSETLEMLAEAETKTDKILILRLRTVNETADELKDMQNHAARLSDGRRVYRNEHGDVYLEDRTRIQDQDVLDSIVWTGNEPSYEQYLEITKRMDMLQKDITDLNDYRFNVLGNARHHMEDQDNPVEMEEMETIQEQIHQQKPSALRIEFNLQNSATPDSYAGYGQNISKPLL